MTEDNIELVVERRVAASPATVFSFFADRDQWLRWQGFEADIDPRPGGNGLLSRNDLYSGEYPSDVAARYTSPSRRIMFAVLASHSRAAVSVSVSSTACRSKVERLMT